MVKRSAWLSRDHCGLLYSPGRKPICTALVLFQRTGNPASLFGVFHAPLTIWAQTLRMRIIPARMRGRSFALLRIIMMKGNRLGGVIAGGLNGLVGVAGLALLSGLIIAVPGAAGLLVGELREAR